MNMTKHDRVHLVIDGLVCSMEGVIVNDFGTHVLVSWPAAMDFSVHSKKNLALVGFSQGEEKE